jgi:hypothetical protein
MTEEEFIKDAKRRGKTKEETFQKLTELKAQGFFDYIKPEKKSFMDKRSGVDNFFAGMGKSIFDTGRGIGNLLGIVSDEEIARARELDKPLMDSTSGMVGNISGHAMQMLAPGAALTKAGNAGAKISQALVNPQSYKAAAGVGGVYSGIQPALSPTERLTNAAMGAGGGAVGLAGGRALQGAMQGGKALLDPITSKGRERIVSRYISDQIDDIPKAIQQLNSAKQYVQGSPVKTSEAMMNPAVSQMERTARNTNPLFNAKIGAIEDAQNKARMDALRGIFAPSQKEARDNMARSAIRHIRDNPINVNPLDKMVKGMKKQNALDDSVVKTLGHIEGKLGQVKNIGDLYDLRKSLTADKLSKADGFDAKTLVNIRNKIDELISIESGVYKDYLKRFADMSKPDNQNAVLDEIMRRSTAPIQNPAEKVIQGADTEILSPAKFAQALKQDEKLVRSATGFNKAGGLKNTLTPQQYSTLMNIKKDLGRSSKALTEGKAIGSNTAQNLAGANIANRTLGSLLPQSVVDVVSTGLPSRAANIVYGGSNEAMNELVNQALANPSVMRGLLEMSNSPKASAELLNALGLLGSSSGAAAPIGLLGQ